MGFYLRKSLTFGPIRFNLSGSGVGASAGVKGFRIGTGPRGNYIHAGRGGLYYRSTLSDKPARPPTPTPTVRSETLTEIESGDVSAMRDSDSAELLAELKEKRGLWRWGPTALVVGLALIVFGWPVHLALAIAGILAAIAAVPLWLLDIRRKTTVLFYELEEPALSAVTQLHAVLDQLQSCHRVWLVEAAGATTDWKHNAGANSLLRRQAIRPGENPPPFVKTNVRVFCLPAGRQRLYFFPDRLLVLDGNNYGAVAYRDLRCEIKAGRFAEEDSVPSDSLIVDKTWRYVNKKGGPDRRFKDNREIPIVAYEYLNLTSVTGLNELFALSRKGALGNLPTGLVALADALNSSQAAPPCIPVDNLEESFRRLQAGE